MDQLIISWMGDTTMDQLIISWVGDTAMDQLIISWMGDTAMDNQSFQSHQTQMFSINNSNANKSFHKAIISFIRRKVRQEVCNNRRFFNNQSRMQFFHSNCKMKQNTFYFNQQQQNNMLIAARISRTNLPTATRTTESAADANAMHPNFHVEQVNFRLHFIQIQQYLIKQSSHYVIMPFSVIFYQFQLKSLHILWFSVIVLINYQATSLYCSPNDYKKYIFFYSWLLIAQLNSPFSLNSVFLNANLFLISFIFFIYFPQISIDFLCIYRSFSSLEDLLKELGKNQSFIRVACLKIYFQNYLGESTKQHQLLWLLLKQKPSSTFIKLNQEGLIKSLTSQRLAQNQQPTTVCPNHFQPKTAKNTTELTFVNESLEIEGSKCINY